jgi:hypothetical protein
MDQAASTSAPFTVSASLRMILRGLLAALGMWRLEPALAVVQYGRIGATLRRIERMLVRFRAGSLRVLARRDSATRRAGSRLPVVRSPRRFGWLVQAGGYQAACYGSQLQTVLNTPDMAALLAVSAQARRVMRPLCRALAMELPWTVDKPRAEMKPRLRKPRPKPEPFRIPLPRRVLSAARRQGFGKMC